MIKGQESSSSDIVLFMGSGLIPFFLFRTILTTSLRVFKQNRNLFQHRTMQPIDVFIANVLFQSVLYAVITILLLALALFSGIDVAPANFDLFMVVLIWLILFAAAWGLLFGILSHFYEFVAKVVSFMSLPLLILSAVFYSLATLPPQAREWLLYNPLTHFMEALHASYLPTLDDHYVSYLYI